MPDSRFDSAFTKSTHTTSLKDATHSKTRTEADNLGEVDIPENAYWGVNVARALTNFPISGRPISIYTDFVFAFACVKQAAARANLEIGVLGSDHANWIDRACEDIKNGKLLDQFVIDIVQGGAGTSTNMNFNEVIANRGLEIAGFAKGQYANLDPNDHVNKGQSTNDVYPTAFKIGLCLGIERYLEELHLLEESFAKKGLEFSDILKVGRTQLMDAVPMTLGQEFESFAEGMRDEQQRLKTLITELGEINLGGTAIGTGIAADPRFASTVCKHLKDITKLDIRIAPNLIEATTDVSIFLDVSGALKRSALKLSKISNDLRLLGSGPQAGLSEIRLPPRQAGSSIMPGKVNPVIPEVVNEVAFAVAGADLTVTMAAEAGQLQLNAFEPIMACSLFTSMQWLTAACRTLRINCIDGIEANTALLEKQMESFVGVITALVPHIGYANAAKLAKQALAENLNIADLVVAQNMLTREKVNELLTAKTLTSNLQPIEP